jgi:hypothetical protein
MSAPRVRPEPQPEIYMPYEQHHGPATALNIVARTEAGDPLSLVAANDGTQGRVAANGV